MSKNPFGQTGKLLEQLSGISGEALQDLFSGGYLVDLREAAMLGRLPRREDFRTLLSLGELMPEITELTGISLVGLGVGLEDQIKAGRYNSHTHYITDERFPLTAPAGPQDLVLARFNTDVESEQVAIWAAAHGYKLGLIDDLLAVGYHTEYMDLQRQFPIIALGSSAVVDSLHYVPFLSRKDLRRSIGMEYREALWGPEYRFLLRKVAVSEKPPFPLLPRETDVYPTPFVPGLTWRERIERCKFSRVNTDVWGFIDKFVDAEEEDQSSRDIEFDHFDHFVSSSEVALDQYTKSKETVGVARFLHFCEQYPNVHGHHPIACLKVICRDGDRKERVLYSAAMAGGRELRLGYRNQDWGAGTRFPFIRKNAQGVT